MSEKRFKLSDWCGEQSVSNIIDVEKQTHLSNAEVVAKLNEQQATIKKLQEENGELRKENKDLNDIEWEKFKKKYHLE